MSFILQVAHLDQRDVRLVSLAMVNDLLLWFGLGAFLSPQDATATENGSGGGETNGENEAEKNGADEEEQQSNIESMLENEMSTDITRRMVRLIRKMVISNYGNHFLFSFAEPQLDSDRP